MLRFMSRLLAISFGIPILMIFLVDLFGYDASLTTAKLLIEVGMGDLVEIISARLGTKFSNFEGDFMSLRSNSIFEVNPDPC